MNIAQIRAQYPQYQDLSDKQLADALHAKFYSDIPIQDYYGRIGLTSPKERTFGEAAKDIAASVVSGAGSLVQLPGQLYGLATGNFADTGALGLGKDIRQYGEEMKSAGLKAREQERAQKIQTAEQKGQWEAFKTAFGETVKDPALLTSFLAEQAPQLLVPFGAARVAQIGTAAKATAAAQGLTGTAAKEAVEAVTKAAAERGTKAAIGAGAVQQGADVGSQAYEDIYKELIRKGASESDAAQGAINLARAAGASGAIISLLAQRLPGARTLEESFAGVKGTSGRLVGALKGAAGEGASEIAEETGGKFGANLAMREVKPEQSLLEGLGQTAGMAAVGGVGFGGVAGALRTPGDRLEVINGKKFINGKPVEEEAPAPPVAQPAAEVPLVEEVPPAPTSVTPEFLTELGIKPTAAVAKRIKGKSLDDPAVATELETYANKYATEESKPKILEFVQSLKPPVEAPTVAEVPAAEAPAAPPVAPAPEAPPVAAVEPSVAEDSELVTPAPVVEAAAPSRDFLSRDVDDVTTLPIPNTFGGAPTENRLFHGGTWGGAIADKQGVVIDGVPATSFTRNPFEALEYASQPGGKVVSASSANLKIYAGDDAELNEKYQKEGASVVKNAGYDGIDLRALYGGGYNEVVVWNTGALQDVKIAPVKNVADGIELEKNFEPITSTAAPTVEAAAPKAEAPAAPEAKSLGGTRAKEEEPDIDRAWRDFSGRNKLSDFDKKATTNVAGEPDEFVLSRSQGKQWVALTVKEHFRDDGATVYSSALEVGEKGFPTGTGAATTMYLEALNIAKNRGMGWMSEGIRSDESRAIYERLKKAGVPFVEEGGSSYIDAKSLASVDLQKVANKLAARPEKVAAEPGTKSLGGERAQVQAFEQDLRTKLNKFGLKDVGLKILDGMTDSGSYAAQIIRIAADAANPVRTLRHEAIHALRELGFFTDAQWKSLSKMAKDKWVDQYLKQRNVDGKPLKAGEESRYDAYMREYNGDMEKITEEAVSDAFADFDATKPPAGLIQALLKRMKDLFQSIKSALTKVESPEQIFGKVEKGELKPGEKAETGERKSLSGKRSTQEIARIFGQMVKRAENEMTSVLFNWNDSQLNEDKDKIIMYPGRDQRFVRGKEGGKSNVSKAEFIDWLMSEGPFDTSVYGEEITSDEKWRNEIETLRGIVEQPDIRKSIGGIKAAAQKALQNQPMPEKGLGHVKQDLKNLAQPIFFAQNKTILDRIDGMKDRFWQRVAQNTADQFRTIKEYSPLGYMQARLSKSVDGGLEGLLFHGQVFDDGGALNIKAKTKGMMDILKPLGNELDSYLMWVALNRESNLPEEKRSKIANMDQLVARRDEFSAGELNGKPRVEVYRDVLRQMNQLNKSVLDIALAKGLINQEAYDKFSGDIYYIPFYKKMEEDGDISGAQTASGLTSQYFSKELKGGDKPFGDLMENVVRNWSHILSASMKNAAAKTTLDDAVELGAAVPNLKVGLEWKDGKVYSIKSGKPIEAKVEEDGKEYAEGELRPDLTKQDAGMAKVMVDGQPMYFKVTDDLLMDSISSIGYLGPKSKFILLMRDFKNMLQYGVTASPIFKVNNLIRDSVAAMAVSDLKKNPVANVLKGISLSDKDSPTYISALAGGAIFNFGSAYEGDQAKLIKRLLDQGVPGDSILDTKEKITKGLKTAWDAYQNLGDKSEAANRLSLYQQMRDKGMTHLQASFMARDLLDFSMQGSWPAFRFFTQVVPFMNARIQGLYKLGRDGIIPTTRVLYNATTGKEIDANDKIRAAQFATITTAVMLASALLYLSFKDDEDFKKRDAWDRDNFWWIKLPGMDVALRVPKPFEVGAFGTLVERSLEQILDEGAEGKQFGESLARTLWDTFALNPTPQMFKPLVDIYSNKDSFSGAPIESAGLERLSKQERATDQTSPLAIALGGITSIFPEKFQLSPVQMDYMLKGYFGWLGAMASVTSTYAVMPFKEGEYPDARWLDRASLGLARELPAPQSAYVTQFYNASKEISQAYADMRHYREMGDAEKVQEILEEKGDKIALAKFYDKTAKNIANVRKQIRLITNDKDMDGAEKKEAIERMKLIMSDLAKQAEEVRKSMKQ
jgi:hypothetical protein